MLTIVKRLFRPLGTARRGSEIGTAEITPDFEARAVKKFHAEARAELRLYNGKAVITVRVIMEHNATAKRVVPQFVVDSSLDRATIAQTPGVWKEVK